MITIDKIKSWILFAACFFPLVFSACTVPIDIDTDDTEPVIVIIGALTDEYKTQEVRISRSSPYFSDQKNGVVSGAVVSITTSGNQVYELVENPSVPGLYQTTVEWAAQAGSSYFLRVEVDFDSDGVKDVYEASTTVLYTQNIDSIKIVPMEIMGHENYALNIYAQDSPEHDYYLYKFAINDTLISTKISKYYTVDDLVFNGSYIDGSTLRYFDSVDNWGTDTEDQRKRSDYLKSEDKVELQMSKISKDYHDFINQCQKEMYGENPFFGGPASNIITNISNGGVGYFSGYCIKRSSAFVL